MPKSTSVHAHDNVLKPIWCCLDNPCPILDVGHGLIFNFYNYLILVFFNVIFVILGLSDLFPCFRCC